MADRTRGEGSQLLGPSTDTPCTDVDKAPPTALPEEEDDEGDQSDHPAVLRPSSGVAARLVGAGARIPPPAGHERRSGRHDVARLRTDALLVAGDAGMETASEDEYSSFQLRR